jgi:predicted O-methyltransferase YrrM
VEATSQTRPIELSALTRYANGAKLALEIGSDQGVSAATIGKSIDQNGILYCVDPWPRKRSWTRNPNFAIFERHTRRTGVRGRINVLLGTSRHVAAEIPTQLDFIFIDGDHSANGIAFDWGLAKQKLAQGGIVCLHDVYVPDSEPWRRPESVGYFETVICIDPQFSVVERIHSLAVLRRNTL